MGQLLRQLPAPSHRRRRRIAGLSKRCTRRFRPDDSPSDAERTGQGRPEGLNRASVLAVPSWAGGRAGGRAGGDLEQPQRVVDLLACSPCGLRACSMRHGMHACTRHECAASKRPQRGGRGARGGTAPAASHALPAAGAGRRCRSRQGEAALELGTQYVLTVLRVLRLYSVCTQGMQARVRK